MKSIIFNSLRFLRPYIAALRLQNIFPRSGWWYDDFVSRFADPIEFAEVEGSKMFVDIRHPDPELRATFRSYAYNQVHEAASTNLLKRIVREKDTFIDVGANIGYFSLLAATLVGKDGQVHSFEPEPRNFQFLCKNLELNSYSQVLPNNMAISEKSGKEVLFVCPYDSGHHTLRQRGGIEEISRGHTSAGDALVEVEVDAVALDDYFSEKNIQPRVLKIDAEGAEGLIVNGMQNFLRQEQDMAILMEFYPALLKEMGTDPIAFAEKLFSDFGLHAYAVAGDYSLSDSQSDLLIELSGAEDALNLCPEQDGHINLYLCKGEDFRRIAS